MKKGDKVFLKGITRAGKNAIHNRGAHWVVVMVSRPIFDKMNGEQVLLENIDGRGDLHWVKMVDDENFHVEVM